jgi:hypothetical protein
MIAASQPRKLTEVEDDFDQLDGRVEASGYRGYEFDDFLASPILRRLSLGSLFVQRVFVQVGERLPFNVRPLLGIERLPSTKANGFFARGYLEAYRATGGERRLDKAIELLDWLLENAAPGYSGLAWGNNFDFASRGGFFPRGLPTVVWTAHIGKAFQLAYESTADGRYADAVVSSGEFVVRDLERHEEAGGVCIAYAPERLDLVHNSNLLGAVSLLRAWALDGDPTKYELARRAFAWSLRNMNPDGSWYYGAERKYRWIDNFHTAYVIDCLAEGLRLAGEEVVPRRSLDDSLRFWRASFFLADGTPRYYHDRTYPLDIQCAAQAIATLAEHSHRDALRVLRWTKANLRRRDGYYMYRRRRLWANPLISIHWGQSTMLEALGVLMRGLAGYSHYEGREAR